jgi:hypothetical protein
MKRKLGLLGVAVIGLTGSATWASVKGIGATQPEKNPVSIREQSVKGPLRTGFIPTRYFISGGPRSGK